MLCGFMFIFVEKFNYDKQPFARKVSEKTASI